MSVFDPYAAWLGLSIGPRPPLPHELLGLPTDTRDAEAIEAAAQEQIARVRRLAPVEAVAETRALIREILAARTRLLDSSSNAEEAGRRSDADHGRSEREAPAEARRLSLREREQLTTLTLDGATPVLPAVEMRSRAANRVAPLRGQDDSESGVRRGWPVILGASGGAAVVAAMFLIFRMADADPLENRSKSAPTAAHSSDERDGRSEVPLPARPVAPQVDADAEPIVARGEPARERPAADKKPNMEADAGPEGGFEVAAADEERPAAAVAEIPADAGLPAAVAAEDVPAAFEVVRLYRAALPGGRDSGRAEQYARALEQLLDAGFGPKSGALAEAKRHLVAGQASAPDDTRLPYAWGLVLWRNHRYDEAIVQFEQALGPAGRPYWPGWQARLWLNLARKNTEIAIEQALDLARECNTAGPNDDARLYCAEWLGRVMGYLALPENDLASDHDAVAEANDRIAATLAGPLRARYEAGRVAVHREFTLLRDEADATLARLAEEHQKTSTAEKSQIATERERRQDEVEKLEMTAEKWKEWIDTQLEAHEKSLTRLVEDFEDLAGQADGIAASLERLNLEIVQIEQLLFDQTGQRPFNSVGTEQAYAAKTTVRDQLRSQYTILDRRATGVRAKALEVQRKRAADVERYRKATGQLIAEGDALQKWNVLLNRREQSLGKPSKGATATARTTRRRLTAFSTYVPLDPPTERERVTAALRLDREGM